MKTLPLACINLVIETIIKYKEKLHSSKTGSIDFSIINNKLTVHLIHKDNQYLKTFEDLIKIQPLDNELDNWFKSIIQE